MLTGSLVILVLRIAVGGVSLLLAASLIALVLGKVRLHGRINMVFFILTATTVVAFELLVRFIKPELFESLKDNSALAVHLYFSVPSALLMPFMLYTGLRHRRSAHLALACVFAVLWTGTFITGVFFLPSTP